MLNYKNLFEIVISFITDYPHPPECEPSQIYWADLPDLTGEKKDRMSPGFNFINILRAWLFCSKEACKAFL